MLTIDDLGIYNINSEVLPKIIRAVPITAIKVPVKVTFQTPGEATITIKYYNSTDQRAGIIEDADSMQYLFSSGLHQLLWRQMKYQTLKYLTNYHDICRNKNYSRGLTNRLSRE